MRTAFAVSTIVFVQSTQALRLSAEAGVSACDPVYQGEVRPQGEQSYAYQFQWIEGNQMYRRSSEIIQGELEMRFCADGTIRDTNNQCLQAIPALNSQNILTECVSGNDSQQFLVTSAKTCNDNLGNTQNCLAVWNVGAQQCLGNQGGSADGGSEGNCDYFNMWRSKKEVHASGRIQNVGSLKCLVPADFEDEARVISKDCVDDADMSWSQYNNGEIIHDLSGLCLGQKQDQGNTIQTLNYCSDVQAQGWTGVSQDGGFYYNRMSDSKSLTSSEDGSEITIQDNNSSDYQKWRFAGIGEWAQPEFTWISVGCDNGVDLTHMFTQTMYLADEDGSQVDVTDEDVDSLSNVIVYNTVVQNTIPVESESVSGVYESIQQMMWHPSDPYVDKQHAFNCGQFEDGTEAVNGGCLWRAKMSVHNWYQNLDLEWHTPLTKCTQKSEPLCPAFTACSDDSCSSCEFSGYTGN